jgi:hypothetical protein
MKSSRPPAKGSSLSLAELAEPQRIYLDRIYRMYRIGCKDRWKSRYLRLGERKSLKGFFLTRVTRGDTRMTRMERMDRIKAPHLVRGL